jgi:hypothetical protein
VSRKVVLTDFKSLLVAKEEKKSQNKTPERE